MPRSAVFALVAMLGILLGGCQEDASPVEVPPPPTPELPPEDDLILAEPADEEVLISEEVSPVVEQLKTKKKRAPVARTENKVAVPALKGMRRARLTQTSTKRPVLGNQQIKRIITERIPQVRACYERELKKSSGLEGKVLVAWTIQKDGTVSSPRVRKNTTGSRRLAPCITKAVARWHFPESNSTSDVEFPFVFKAKEDWR